MHENNRGFRGVVKEEVMLYLTEYASPLGMMTLVSNKNGLVGAWIEGQKYFASTLKEESVMIKFKFVDESYTANRCERKECGMDEYEKEYSVDDKMAIENLKKAVKWIERYFDGEQPEIKELVLAPKGSEFRQIVWKNLCEIPYGKVATYGELAKKVAVQMGKERMSAQAVGGAVGHNPISVIIPCHRVVGADGSLTGYAGGIEKKRMLLEMEGVL